MKVPSRNNIFTISVALLVMGISAVIFISVKKDSDLPVYEGKTVEEWFYGEDGNPTSLSTRHDAAVAFEAVGEKSIPFLIQKFQRPFLITQILEDLEDQYRKFAGKKPIPRCPTRMVQTQCIWHLNALPMNVLESHKDALWGLAPALRSYGYVTIESQTKRYDKSLLKNLENRTAFFELQLINPNFLIKLESAIILCSLNPGMTNGIPVLIKAINQDSEISFPGRPNVFIKSKQLEAHRALTRIAPELADQYPLE